MNIDKLLEADKTEITSAQGQIIENYPEYGNVSRSINLSDIWTAFIKTAAKHCEYYASDIIIDIDTIREHIETLQPYNDITRTYLFGYRNSGVDHTNFIECRNSSEYKSMQLLTIAVYDNTITATLYNITDYAIADK